MVRRVGDEIHVEVECVGMTKARIVVALIPEEGTLEDRQIRRVEPLVDAPDTLVSCVATFRAPRVRGPAHVVLSYDGVACDQVLTGTPDSRAAVHQLYDTDMRFLQECLTPGKSQRDRIEEGLALLLHLLGFSAACYGYGKFNPSPDVVAFCDDGRALVCECSWTPPDPDMITKARQRADDVRNTLRALGADARVIPVVVTAASPESNPEASLSPRAQGVATLAREDVDRWIALARHGESRERFWNTMENLARPLDRWEREL
jgi:hypothetical protein